MKKSCLTLLVLLFALTGVYFYLFSDSSLQQQYWLPPALALSVVFTVANFMGITQALRQRSLSQKAPRDWREGELIALSGKLQPLRQPVLAPFSGRACSVVEYELRRETTTDSSTSSTMECMGMLMTPSAIHSPRGQIRLVGFPLMTTVPHDDFDSEADYKRAAQYFVAANFKEKSGNPIQLLKELNKVLNDDDGDLREDFKNSKFAFYGDSSEYDELDQLEEIEESKLTEDQKKRIDELYELLEKDDNPPSENSIFNQLKESGFNLREQVIPAGAEVTVFGTYRASKQAIDIGGGLTNLMHAIHLGPIDKVIGGNFRKALIMTLIFGAISLTAHQYVFLKLGVDLYGEVRKVLG